MNTTGNVKLTPMEYADVRGKKLLYLKMEANGKELIINIGKATYEGAVDLLQPRVTQTTLNIMDPVTPDIKKP